MIVTTRRRFLLFSILLVSLIAAAGTEYTAEQYFTFGIPYGTSALQSYHGLPHLRFGINTFLEDDVYPWQLKRDFQALHAAGFTWIRQEFLWAQIEPGHKGNFYDYKNHVNAWAKWDRIVNYAQRYHIKILARLDFAPRWATAGNPDSGRCPALCPPPNNPQDFADFARAVAEHFRGRIAAYQIWNEPNLQVDWAGRPISPAAYTAMLKEAYIAIKSVDPSALVVTAALAPNRGDSPNNMSDLAFLRGMYAAGAKGYFDVLAAQGYGLNSPAYNRQIGFHYYDFPRAILPSSQPFTLDRPLLLRQIMEQNGDTHTPIWITEFGWISLPPHWLGNPSPWSDVTPQQRVQYTVQAYERAKAEWPFVGPMFLWYLRTPVAVNPRDPTPYFAILGQNWQPTPVYKAVQLLATQPARAGVGLHSPFSNAVHYGRFGFPQAWVHQQVDGHPAAVAEAPGANAAFEFTGEELWLQVVRGPLGGPVRVTIDNVPDWANAVPATAGGNRIINTYSPTVQPPQLIPIATGLAAQPHELELQLLSSGHPQTTLTITGYGVANEKPAIWSYLKLALLLAVALLFAWPFFGILRWFATNNPFASYRTHPLIRFWVTLWSRDSVTLSAWIIVSLIFFLSPSVRGTELAIVAIGFLGLFRPKGGLLLMPAAMAFEFLPRTVGHGEITLGELFVIACTLGWLARSYWQQRLLLPLNPVTGLAIALLLIGFISLFAAQFPRFSLRDYRTVIVEPVLYLFALVSLFHPREVRYIVSWAVAAGTAIALLSLGAFALHRGVVSAQGVLRLSGIYPSPDNLALYLDRPVAMALALTIWSKRPQRLWWGAALCIMLLVELLTFTRGAWLAIAGTAVIAGFIATPLLIIAVVGSTVVAVVIATITHVQRLISIIQLTRNSTTERRLLLWQASWHMIQDHPLQGIGLDNFLYQYGRYRLPGADSEPFLSHPHNLLLDFWLSLGILGLGWLLTTISLLILLTRRLLALLPQAEQPIAWALILSLIVSAFHGFVDNSFFLPDLATLFWLAAGGLQLLRNSTAIASSSQLKEEKKGMRTCVP